jgi:hypothetical protein
MKYVLNFLILTFNSPFCLDAKGSKKSRLTIAFRKFYEKTALSRPKVLAAFYWVSLLFV